MTASRSRSPALVRVVFDGQSMNVWPPFVFSSPDGRGPMPDRVMSGRGIPFANVAIGNMAWGTVGGDSMTSLFPTAATRLYPQARSERIDVLVMTGGTNDVFVDKVSGSVAYGRVVSYADAARNAGFDFVVGVTIPPVGAGSTLAPGVSEYTAQSDHNGLMLGGTDFDAVADVSTAPLDDPTDAAHYEADQVHWRAGGAAVAADRVGAALDSVLALI